jgi:short-chain fatty acids transporter
MQFSGLGDLLSQQFVQWSTPSLFPLLGFLSAGLLNFFVPSGGGQWVVQGPILMKAGLELGVPASKTALAIAWGDAWTNLVQPFWALPMLAMAGLQLKDIMGACVSYLLLSGLIIGLGFLIF